MTEIKSSRAVVLLQLGGPDSQEAVEPFLHNLFRDPDIIDLPGAFLFREALARRISKSRSPRVRKLYQALGGHSPLLRQTQEQARALQRSLAAKGHNMRVEIAMRYWHPFTEETLQKLVAEGTGEFILLPLYPHFSKTTTGSSVNEWNRVCRSLHVDQQTRVIDSYFDHPLYIDSLVNRVREAINRFPESERSKVHLVFSAHGTPEKLVRDGDPYSHQIRKTYELVIENGKFELPHHLCFQSKVGPQKWLKPSLHEIIKRLGSEGITHVVVNPIAFVSDHIETLSEINIEARKEAKENGIHSFEMTDPLLTEARFIECLSNLVIREMNETA